MTKTMVKSRSFADRLLVRGGRRRPLPGALWPNMTLAYITRTHRAEIRLTAKAVNGCAGPVSFASPGAAVVVPPGLHHLVDQLLVKTRPQGERDQAADRHRSGTTPEREQEGQYG